MELYEKLKSLPDAEKAKYFEVFLECTKLTADGSSDPEKADAKKNFCSFLNSLTSGHNISSEVSPRKRQKTLDSWLIKSKNLSPLKNKPGESSRTLDNWLIKPKELPSNKSKSGESSCTVKESSNQILSSDVSESLDSTQTSPSNLDGCNSLRSSKNIDNSPKSKQHPLSKFDNVNNSPVKNALISPSENCKTTITETKSYSLRPKRKRRLNAESPDKSSIQSEVGDSGLTKFNKETINSEAPNNIDINQDSSPPSVYPDVSNKSDCSEADNSLNKNTKNPRSRESNSGLQNSVQPSRSTKRSKVTEIEDLNISDETPLNLQNSVQSSRSTKRNKVTEIEDLSISDETPPGKSKLQKTTHSSSSLSNWEAFCVLESICARINLNVLDILENERVQNVLNDPKRLNNDTTFLINSFESKKKILPVVHLIESRKKLTEMLKKLKKPV